jgi:hypothetical protein
MAAATGPSPGISRDTVFFAFFFSAAYSCSFCNLYSSLFISLFFCGVVVDSKASPVVGNPGKVDDMAPIVRSKVPRWYVGTKKRMLRSKTPGISIFGNKEEATKLYEGNG